MHACAHSNRYDGQIVSYMFGNILIQITVWELCHTWYQIWQHMFHTHTNSSSTYFQLSIVHGYIPFFQESCWHKQQFHIYSINYYLSCILYLCNCACTICITQKQAACRMSSVWWNHTIPGSISVNQTAIPYISSYPIAYLLLATDVGDCCLVH